MKRNQRGRGKLIDGGKYAVLAAACTSDAAQEGTRMLNEGVGGYRTKAVQAGEFLYISVYPLIGCNANRHQRARLGEMHEKSITDPVLRAKYAKFNNARRAREFEMLVHANFQRGDLHVCLTYDMENYGLLSTLDYITREDARRDARNFLRRVKRLLKKSGCDLNKFRWISCTVTKESLKEGVRTRPDRHHHHLLLHGVPEALRGDIERLWGKGYANADRLQDGTEGLGRIAGYIARQESSANGENSGERSYTCSRNILRPRVTTCDSRISRARVAKIAADVRVNGQEIFAKLFPRYRLTEEPRVETSSFVAGAYIYARLRRTDMRSLHSMPAGKRAAMIA